MHIAAKIHRANGVRARSNRCVGDDFVQRLALAPAVAEDRHAPHNQRQFGVDAFEIKPHQTLTQHHHRLDLCKVGAVLGGGSAAGELVKRVLHIQSQHRVAIVKAGLRSNFEGRRQAVC